MIRFVVDINNFPELKDDDELNLIIMFEVYVVIYWEIIIWGVDYSRLSNAGNERYILGLLEKQSRYTNIKCLE